MTVPKWLLPAISVIVALAVAIAAVIISGRFVPSERVEANVESETITTPLYGPSGFGDDEEYADLPEGAFGESPELGEIEVSAGLPSDPGVTPLEDATERIADGGAEGDDIPTVVEDETATGAATTDGEPAAEDPCIAAGDCPEDTVMGRIFALVSPPEYQVRVRAFAPASLCAAGASGSVSVLVFMTRPSEITLTVERVEGGGRVQQFEQTTPPAQATAWNDALAAAEGLEELPFLYLCFVVPGAEPGVVYQATVDGRSLDGASASDSTEYNGAGPTHHPVLSIEPIGDGAAVAYTEHTEDEQVAIRAWLMPEDSMGIPGCYDTGSYTEIDWRYRSYGELTPEQTGNLLIPADANQRTAVSFQVPEGSTIVFCATWYPGEEAPSWERVQSLFVDGAVLRTTDYVLPKVTLVRVALNPRFSEIDAVGVYGRTQEGSQCGGYEFDPLDPAALPHVVCELTGASTEFNVHDWSYRDVGFTGNIVIPMRVTNAGTEFRGEGTLNIGSLMCLGGCTTNPTTRYDIPLPAIEGNSTGRITLQVSWEQGASNGLVRPIVSDVPQRGELVEAAGGEPLPWAQPMMDTDERIVYDHVSSTDLSGVATLPLITDRPVDYTLTMEGLAGDDCAVGDAPLSVSGHSDGEKDVEISGLCLGHFYWATVHLTDEFGASTTFSAERGGVTRWLASLVRIPPVEVRVSYAAVINAPPDSAIAPGSYITIDGVNVPLGARTCTRESGVISSGQIIIVPITSHPVVDVHIETVPALTNDADIYCSGLVTREATTVVGEGTATLDLQSMREARGGSTTITVGDVTLVFSVLA